MTPEKKSMIMNWVILGAIFLSIGASFLRYVVFHDYYISAEVPCDPSAEKCFIRDCEANPEGTGCDALPEGEKLYPFKTVERNYRRIDCAGGDPRCLEPSPCAQDESDCREILCESEDCAEVLE